MTSEIVIMNTQAVAMAADSAVTLGGEKAKKIFVTALKIFALSSAHPVGIMMYGSAEIMGIPWETIIKLYRKKLGGKEFPYLKDYAIDILKFLNNNRNLFPKSKQDSFFKSQVASYFSLIKENIERELRALLSSKKQFSTDDVSSIKEKIINNHYRIWKSAKPLPSLQKSYQKNILNKYRNQIHKIQKEIFEGLPLDKSQSSRLAYIASGLFAKSPEGVQSSYASGIVVAGFGGKDIFPSLVSYLLEGVVNNRLKYKIHNTAAVTFNNAGSIVPFAQAEMVYAFMEGVDVGYQREIEEYFKKLCTQYPEKIVDSIDKLTEDEKNKYKRIFKTESIKVHGEYMKKLGDYRKKTNVSRVMAVVTMLPKDELASMAESLINLTSLKRKVTIGEEETVGGPIDVAVISKGDGFIWIKRKHYFKPELNPQFFAKYKGERKNGVKTQGA